MLFGWGGVGWGGGGVSAGAWRRLFSVEQMNPSGGNPGGCAAGDADGR